MHSSLMTLATGLALSLACQAASLDRAASHYDLGEKSLAIEGYDPVADFKEGGGAPALGDTRKKWSKKPARFLPFYEGSAALALASGKLTAGDPSIFVRAGKALFFFTDIASRDAWTAAAGKRGSADRL